jgi:hypothetical protein
VRLLSEEAENLFYRKRSVIGDVVDCLTSFIAQNETDGLRDIGVMDQLEKHITRQCLEPWQPIAKMRIPVTIGKGEAQNPQFEAFVSMQRQEILLGGIFR